MDGFLPIFFLMVILKIPVAAMLYLVWWAYRASDEPEGAPPESDEHRFGRFRREPKRPRGPRRGGHGPDAVPVPDCPPGGRTRILTAPAPVRAATTHAAGRGSAEPLER
ncbi:MAG: hypothetical protein GEU88_11335 [Solirubrobacterales bacterium]|nr:hypothetical protein [Solirubrobacterales bacterium]